MVWRLSSAFLFFSLRAFSAQHVEQGGIAIDFSLAPASLGPGKLVSGSTAVATFRVTDARTGEPLSGLRPKAWFSARRSEAVATETSCSDKVRTFMSGQISARPDADLNSYLLVTLNHDKTVTFINPQIASNISKLESVVVLPSSGSDWALTPGRDTILITLPDASAVALVSAYEPKLLGVVSTGESSKPVRIAVHPDGQFAWVTLEAANKVAVIDIAKRKLQTVLPLGAGPHSVALSADGRWASVTNAGANSATVFDAHTFARSADVPLPATPVSQAWSSAAGMFYVGSLNGNAIAAVDPRRGTVAASIASFPGTVAIAFDPDGRLGFAINQLSNRLTVFDPATNRIVAEGATVSEPDQIVFTRLYAYVHGLGSEKFSLFDLAALRRSSVDSAALRRSSFDSAALRRSSVDSAALRRSSVDSAALRRSSVDSAALRRSLANEPLKLLPVDIQGGRLVPSSEPSEIGPAPMIVPTPEGNSVMIANGPDRMIYYYAEGMMAPMGTLQNYRRIPRGLMVLDRSLSETVPGVFSAPVHLPAGGRFDVPVLLDQPRMIHCFQADIAEEENPKTAAHRQRVKAEFLSPPAQLRTGATQVIRVRLTDPATHLPLAGLQDVQLLVLKTPGIAQRRAWMSEKQAGVYETVQAFSTPGVYQVLISVPSRGTKFSDLPIASVNVASEMAATSGGSK